MWTIQGAEQRHADGLQRDLTQVVDDGFDVAVRSGDAPVRGDEPMWKRIDRRSSGLAAIEPLAGSVLF